MAVVFILSACCFHSYRELSQEHPQITTYRGLGGDVTQRIHQSNENAAMLARVMTFDCSEPAMVT